MNDERCSIVDAIGPGRIERQGRRWRLVALICASVLGAVVFTGQSRTSQTETETAGSFECSNCQRPVREEEPFCANCGTRTSAPETVGTFECSNCQRPVREEESFCANCGTRFSE